jgi:DNA end-binding protein Ku
MRRKEYVGALRLQEGYPMLIALRHAEEVVSPEDLKVPGGAPLDERELAMARQLMEMLASDFDPAGYQDEYRGRVEELIQIKGSGREVETLRPCQPRPSADLAGALEASLKRERKRA